LGDTSIAGGAEHILLQQRYIGRNKSVANFVALEQNGVFTVLLTHNWKTLVDKIYFADGARLTADDLK
jgi:hypothetical protein